MRSIILAAMLAALVSSPVVAGEGDFVEYQRILNDKCSQCHPRARIEDAIQRGANFDQVIQKMIRFGARISEQEKAVLGVFWRSDANPQLAEPQPGRTVAADSLGVYRAVLQSRCTGCHSLAKVEEAMAEGRSLDDLIEMMRKRGAIISEAEKNALAPYWGSPYK